MDLQNLTESMTKLKTDENTQINEDVLDTQQTRKITEENFIPQPLKKNGSTSDSEWESTTDTSINSSPLQVPPEVLEACDGLDDASTLSLNTRSSRRRGSSQEESESTSASSSSWDSEASSSTSYDTASSSSSSSPSSGSYSSSDSSCCSCSHCSCTDSCSCSESDSSFSSSAKRGARRLGPNNCAQS